MKNPHKRGKILRKIVYILEVMIQKLKKNHKRVNKTEHAILEVLRSNPYQTQAEIADCLKVSVRTVSRNMKHLKDK